MGLMALDFVPLGSDLLSCAFGAVAPLPKGRARRRVPSGVGQDRAHVSKARMGWNAFHSYLAGLRPKWAYPFTISSHDIYILL